MEYQEFNPEGFQLVEKETWEAICDYRSYDNIVDAIYNTIEELEIY